MASTLPIKLTPQILLALAVLIFGVGMGMGKYLGGSSLGAEGFTASSLSGVPICAECEKQADSCKCTPKGMARLICPPCRDPDMSKYVLKSSIPPCPSCPDMTNYMLKTECPPVPDLSKYVLKSSVPTPQPVIMDCSKCAKPKGECPPCPRPRCPEVRCAEPTKCPPPAPCPRLTCPQPVVKCRTEEPVQNSIRPFLAPLSTMGFGLG